MSAPWQPLLDWWFGDAQTPAQIVAAKGGLWFGKRDSQDREAQERFGDLVEQALAGGLTEWAQSPQGWLALVLLLDQLPRMIHRDTPGHSPVMPAPKPWWPRVLPQTSIGA